MFRGAMCSGRPTEWWYPVRDGKTHAELSEISRNMKLAIELCRACPACADCMVYSIENNEVGIWGGMGEKTRKRARRMLRHGASPNEVVSELLGNRK